MDSHIGKIWDTIFLKNDEWKYLHEWWRMDIVLEHFFWKGISNKMYFTKDYDLDKIINIFNWLENDEILTTATYHADVIIKNKKNIIPNYLDYSQEELDYIIKSGWMTIECIDWKKMDYICGHAYSIWEYNTKDWWVELINPYDTQNQRYKIEISKLAGLFNYLVVSKFK